MDRLWTPWRYNYVSQAEPDARKGVPPELAAWPADQDRHCVFCNLVASTSYAIASGMESRLAFSAARIVHRGQHCFICLNLFPYGTGHILLVPYEHQDSLAKLSLDAAVEMMQLARLSEDVLRKVYRPHGLNLGMNLGEAAGAGVASHLHLHALPRWSGDTSFITVVGETRVLPEALETTWAKLEQAYTLHATPGDAKSSRAGTAASGLSDDFRN